MSDHSGQSMTSCQSGWISRWGKNGSKERAQNNNCSSSSLMNKESSSSKEVASSGCSPAKALEEIKSGFSILKPESSKMASTGMETRKLLCFPGGEGSSDRKDSQAAASDAKDSLDFDTKLSLRCYIPREDKNQPMECHSEAKGVAENPLHLVKDLDVSSPDMLQLGLGQHSRPELDDSISQRNSKAPVSSESQDRRKMMVIWNQPNKPESSQTTQSLLISPRIGLDSRTVGPPANVRRASAPSRENSTHLRLSAMPPPPPPVSSSDWMTIYHIVDKGKRAIDDLDEKDDAAAEKANMELDEFILQNTLIKGSSPPPSKMLKLTLPVPQLSLAAPRPLALKSAVGNLQLPSLPALNNLGGATSSRTESLGLETLLTHAEPLHQCKAGPGTNQEPGTSWIKRLKLSASDMSGSKVSSIEDVLPHVKKVQNPEKASDPLTSRPWMRRWCRVLSEDPQTKATPICDPRSKLALPEIPEKQFPSIAAMALMGKAMNGFQPGEYKKKGSVTVWNDRGY